jgi:hypothetical protein
MMVDDLDDLILLLLRSGGKRAAVKTFEEETGAGHAEAVHAVERLARKHGFARTGWPTWRTGMIIAAALTVSVLCLVFTLPF